MFALTAAHAAEPTASSSSVATLAQAPAPVMDKFRTPARLYGTAYSVKIKLKRGEFNWVVPVWIKPDQKTSSFDPATMGLMGWAEPKFNFDEVSLSGEKLAKLRYASQKSEWAYFPDYAKSCCVGVIGQDVLKGFQIYFDPRPPAHLEWTRLSSFEQNRSSRPKKISESDLRGIFNVQGTIFQERDLTAIPYTLNLEENWLEFDDKVVPPKTFRASTLFQYEFLPPARNVQVHGISGDVSASAAKVGLKSGATLIAINGDPIGKLDRLELDQILKGKKKDLITITMNAGKDAGGKTTSKDVTFDFKKNTFSTTEPVPSHPR
ncbi:MAG: hypothetical protein JST80_11120 [Bdellovibrionales bacterium]|nr:hypothetical protein [Bdellovibrionales bacterium]